MRDTTLISNEIKLIEASKKRNKIFSKKIYIISLIAFILITYSLYSFTRQPNPV